MSAQQRHLCPQCGHGNPEGSRFCNNCGARLERAAAPATAVPSAAHPSPKPGPEEVLTLPVPEILSHKAHRSQLFYAGVFAALAIITIVEVGVFYVDVTGFKVPSLLLLSTAKFALVAMFFMHLKGDRRFFSLLFVAPLLIGASLFVAVTALFRNF